MQLSQTYRVSYALLLRQYRLAVGTVYQNFTRFDEVTRVLSRLRGWHIADKSALKKDQVYQAAAHAPRYRPAAKAVPVERDRLA